MLDEQLREQVEKTKANVKLLDSIRIPNLSKTGKAFDVKQVLESEWFFS